MEDRPRPLLHLELGDATPEQSAARARRLAQQAHVERVTWWENAAFERTDLPMRIRDGHALVVVEASEGYEAPPPPDGVSESHCFHRFPRPSQGILT
ncbi:MAG TPA: hypothetical protein VK773_10750, partial [Acidimicrobiales bacterium]|nr:hypothetical protein [Acidimicrobiales bacterium]